MALVDELQARVVQLEERLRELHSELSGLTTLTQMIARLEQIVENIRVDLSEMKDEWMRIRGRVHKLEDSNAGAIAAAAALEAAKAERLRTEDSNWSQRTRGFFFLFAACGALGGISALIVALVTLLHHH